MFYDLTKCNNLRWECDGLTGVIKAHNDNVCILSDTTWLGPHGEIQRRSIAHLCSVNMNDFYAKNKTFKIVPRDPITYSDWQVGDVAKSHLDGRLVECIFRDGELACFKELPLENWKETDKRLFTTFVMYDICKNWTRNYDLVLTDYEKQFILEEEVEIKVEATPKPNDSEQTNIDYTFEKNDKVLVRNSAMETWKFGIFYRYAGENVGLKLHVTTDGEYEECIPYNEKTWKLLGTTDMFKR